MKLEYQYTTTGLIGQTWKKGDLSYKKLKADLCLDAIMVSLLLPFDT